MREILFFLIFNFSSGLIPTLENLHNQLGKLQSKIDEFEPKIKNLEETNHDLKETNHELKLKVIDEFEPEIRPPDIDRGDRFQRPVRVWARPRPYSAYRSTLWTIDKDEFDQLNLYCYCLFGINGFVLFLCCLVISSRMLNHKTCYLLLMICTFLTAIVFLVILGLTVGISFTQGTVRWL